MAKNKKYADQADAQAPATTEAPQTTDAQAPSTGGNPNFVRKPGIFLQDEAGVQYKFDRRELPKKAAVAGSIIVDGQSLPFQVTSNKGWTPEDKVIEYIWVNLPRAGVPTAEDPNPAPDMIPGYITLDYLVPASSFNGKQFSALEGTANRANPERVPKSVEAEEKRKAAAKATLEAKKAAAPAAEPAAQPEGEPQAQ